MQDLSLDYIFGYRGFDTRHNLLYSSDGLIVYPAAGAGVVYNPLTRQQSFYLEHNDDIICVGLNRNPKLSQVVATGKSLDVMYMYLHMHNTQCIYMYIVSCRS